jgi:hypothetical protein
MTPLARFVGGDEAERFVDALGALSGGFDNAQQKSENKAQDRIRALINLII